MRLSMEKVRTGKNYRIGYIALIDEYVMATGKCENGLEVNDYYRISPDVYELHKRAITRLDQVAETLKTQSEGFLFSDDMDKNSESQKELYLSCRDSQKERVTGEADRI